MISERGKRGKKPALTYMGLFSQALADPYDSKLNKNGFLCLTVAENKISFEKLLSEKYLSLHQQASKEDLEKTEFPPFYGDFRGFNGFKVALSNFITNFFLSDFTKEKYFVSPSNFVIASGCSSLIESLAWIIGDDGDSIIIPAPYYPAFDSDLVVRSSLNIIKAHLSSPNFELTEEILNKALKKSNGKAKALLITNPGNPLGICYSKEELKLALNFSKKNNLFLISDEIYAKSVYGKTKNEFISMFDICVEEDNKLGNNVIIMYGFSKDFCISGTRVGCIYTENKEILQIYSCYSMFSSVSSFTQLTLTKLLNDEIFIKNFLKQGKQLLLKQSNKLKETLQNLNISYINAVAGLFIVADFKKKICERYKIKDEEISFTHERNFFEELANLEKIVMTPGQDCNFKRPGYFRICFMFSEEQALEELNQRLNRFLN